MNPATYNQAKNVFLLFPPGAGGNHVANMLSLHDDFEDRYRTKNYQQEMIGKYYYKFELMGRNGEYVAHFSDLENLQPNTFDAHIDYILQTRKKYIFCAHAYEYLSAPGLLNKFDLITDKIYILFSRPTKANLIAYLRMTTGPWGQVNLLDSTDMYTIDGFLKTGLDRFARTYLDKNKILFIDTDKFYTMDGFDYFQETLGNSFGINLPKICKELHQLYIKHKVLIYKSMMP